MTDEKYDALVAKVQEIVDDLDEILEGQPPSPPPPESLEHCPNPQECGDCSAPPERPFPECPTAPFTGWDDEPAEPAPKDGECQIQAMGHDCEIHGVPVEPQSLEPEPDDDDKYGEALSEGAENNQVRQRLAKLEGMHDYDFDGKDSIVGALYGRVEALEASMKCQNEVKP